LSPFFVNYEDGRVATRAQLIEAGIAPETGERPPRPWHPIRGSSDASTLWYAVMVKRERGVYIGTLSIRHSDRYHLLLRSGWREVPVAEIGVGGPPAPAA
jgi:hypothetical protein